MTEPRPPYHLASSDREAEIQRQIVQVLYMAGFLVLRVNSGSNGAHIPFVRWFEGGGWINSGVSDILAESPAGKLWAVEVKRPGEAPSKDQCRFLQAVIQRGGVGLVASTVEQIIEAIGGVVTEACPEGGAE